MELVVQQFFDLFFAYGNVVLATLVATLQDERVLAYWALTSLLVASFAMYHGSIRNELDKFALYSCVVLVIASAVMIVITVIAFLASLYNGTLVQNWNELTQHQRNFWVRGVTLSTMILATSLLLYILVKGTKKLITALGIATGILLFYFNDGMYFEETLRIQLLIAGGVLIFLSVIVKFLIHTSRKRNDKQPATRIHFSKKRSLERYREKQLMREQRKAARAARLSRKRRRF